MRLVTGCGERDGGAAGRFWRWQTRKLAVAKATGLSESDDEDSEQKRCRCKTWPNAQKRANTKGLEISPLQIPIPVTQPALMLSSLASPWLCHSLHGQGTGLSSCAIGERLRSSVVEEGHFDARVGGMHDAGCVVTVQIENSNSAMRTPLFGGRTTDPHLYYPFQSDRVGRIEAERPLEHRSHR